MRSLEKLKDKKCYWCGSQAVSVDHVPSKNLFERPYPNNLITVPACEKHNRCFSDDEEWFRNHIIGMSFSKQGIRMWADKGKRSVQRNLKMGNEMRSNLIDIGDDLTAIKFDSDRANRVIEKIVRGLYFHHFKKRLSEKINLVIGLNPIDNLINKYKNYSQFFNIQDDSFCYRFMNAVEDTDFSMWWLRFHKNSLFVVGITKEKIL